MNERPIPWYKNHILLLIILIPLATVCGSMYTIYLAVSSKEAPILDDYSKTGLSPQMRQEGRTDITATLTDGAITLQREPPSIEALTLTLQHASKAALDQRPPMKTGVNVVGHSWLSSTKGVSRRTLFA